MRDTVPAKSSECEFFSLLSPGSGRREALILRLIAVTHTLQA